MNEIIEVFQQRLQMQAIEVVFLAAKHHIFYMTGLPVTSASVNPVAYKVPMVLVVPQKGKPILFAPAALKQFVDDLNYEGELYHYPTTAFIEYRENVARPILYASDLSACVERFCRERIPSGARCGVDSDFQENFATALSGIDVTEVVDDLVAQQRRVKTEREISLMKTAAIASYAGMAHVERLLARNGGGHYTEEDLFYEARRVILSHRCQWGFTSLMAGRYSADLYHQPTDYVVKDGDYVRMDFGAVYRGYRSDVARTVCAGTPRPEDLRLATVLQQGVDLIIERMRPGVRLGDLYDLCMRHVVDKGYPLYRQRALFGHCVGIEVEETPTISEGSKFVIEENMVFSVETPYYIKDHVGFSHEDAVVIRNDGAHLLRDVDTVDVP